MKVTNDKIKVFIKSKLSTNKVWAQKAMLIVYNLQTEDEKSTESTNNLNGVGFTGADAYIMTSFSKQLLKRGDLSPKQMAIVYKNMPKYWRQIKNASNDQKLRSQVAMAA